jgi:hypothetical protein
MKRLIKLTLFCFALAGDIPAAQAAGPKFAVKNCIRTVSVATAPSFTCRPRPRSKPWLR